MCSLSTVVKRSTALSESDTVLLKDMGFPLTGLNSDTADDGVWFGDDGPYTNEFCNESGEDLFLFIWGVEGSWVNVKQPLITTFLANGSCITISFAYGQTGAWSAVYPNTKNIDGQIAETWGEYTMKEQGCYDVSKLPNMDGRPMAILGPKCVSDFDRCVFVCKEGNRCMINYELENCAPGSQPDTQYGLDYGAPSGGCGIYDRSANFTTLFY